MRVLANDFAAQWEEICADGLAAVDRVGSSGWLVLGEEVERFERAFAEWWGVDHAVGVASGLDALEIALRCCGVASGDRVLTTPLTAYATTLAILRVGAEPVWVDVDATGGLDLEAVESALEADADIRFLLPVHLYGHPLDPDRLARIIARFDVMVVEDCAQSAGASRGGRPTGVTGRMAATSLYPTKNLGAYGDGGVVLVNDGELAAQARILRNYGQQARYHHVEVGLNSRLDELQAAILRSALLPRLDGWLARRASIAKRYGEALGPTPLRPVTAVDGASSNHLFPVEVLEGDPEEVRQMLTDQGVKVERHYPVLCSEQPASAGRGSAIGDLSVARRLAERELSLPIHPYLGDSAVDHVIDACHLAVSRLSPERLSTTPWNSS